MQTLPNSPPLLRHPGGDDDVDIDFRDVFGGPPKRRSKVIETTSRHSFSEIRRRDVIVDNSALILRDEKPVFGEDPSLRRRFTADDFFDDIFRVNESSSSSSPQRKIKNERETFGSSLPGSRIPSPAHPVPHKAESPGTSFPAQFSLPAKLIKGTEIPTFGSAARSLSRNKEAASSSPLSRTSSKADMVGSTVKPDSEGYVAPKVVNGKGRQFHFSIYKWPNKGVPVVMWGSSRLSSMAKAEDAEPSGLSGMSEEKKTTQKPPGVQKEEEMSEQAFSSNVSRAREANVKPLHAFLDVKDEKQGEDIVLEKEARKGKSKAKSMRSYEGDSRSKKKPQGSRSSLDSPMPDKSSYASTSTAQEAGKDGAKGKVMDFVKIFSQGPTGGESLGQSSRWRAKDTPVTDINKDGAKAKETAKVPDPQKKSSPVSPAMDQDQKPSQANQKKVPNSSSKKPSGVVPEQEEKQEPSTAHVTSEDIDEPFHVNFLVEDITQDENKIEETRNDAAEFQNIDAKIRKWSSGKSGNIRSLLSTLQYILWPGCGWKAVPLMDMIEGNAVRKSYQRALLILHPDKLQQKGASANQKYMAEKVFELLQEAWDHFNTLGPV
ncbi:J domain-containing protein required for chloroplast accumulation response 1 [Hirschfeldia incana]|nr:J domain-containing protein required for chloroplast accumulation response 1 [Hirschfeldia incana]